MSGRSYRAFALISIVGSILSSSHLRLSHEGIQSYASYLREHDGVAARLLSTAHSVDLSDAPGVLSNVDLPTHAEKTALDEALAWCRSIDRDVRNVGEIFQLESLIREL